MALPATAAPPAEASVTFQDEKSTGMNVHTTSATNSRYILLATAQLTILTESERQVTVRALIDPCSEASFLTENIAQRLRLPRQSVFVPITGVGAAPSYTARSAASIKFASRFNDDQHWKIRVLLLPKLTEYLPSPQLVTTNLSFTENLRLADPDFNSGSRIEMILGADIFPRIIQEGLRHSPDGRLIAQSTSLGWILTGSTSTAGLAVPSTSSLQCICDTTLSRQIERFWIQEDASSFQSPPLTAEEQECERHFLQTHKRDDKGRFILRLPFKSNLSHLGDSFSSAMNTLRRTERRFAQHTQFKLQYVQFMEDYKTLGHMKPAPNNCSPARTFFLPHHGVFKAHGDTHKLRVVFNGSVKLPTGHSLNDCLHAGPKLQLDIFDVLLAWRKHRIAFTADIKQMFRQIQIAAQDQPLQQILWRASEEQPILAFFLTTVTYGLTSSPYQAIRTLLQLASDEESENPRAAILLRHNRYVDDILGGADSIPDALTLKEELIQLLMAGGFPLSKWTSNHEDVLAELPLTERATADSKVWRNHDEASAFRTLGVSWQPTSDSFSFSFDLDIKEENPVTKRGALSLISQLYDPLGWITPVTVTFKIFMQRLWHSGLQWDDTLPDHLQERWSALMLQLRDLPLISIPRWVGYSPHDCQWEIHGFSDASERAYAACLYLRTISTTGEVTSILLTSKTKLAPLKQVSLPRLELCGALILARLTKRVQSTLSMQAVNCHLWSDSTIALAWLRESPTTWKTYVANRVSEIQTTVPQAAWHHVSGKENPADLASRGITPAELSSSSLWLHGPSFLTASSESWNTTEVPQNVDCPEKRTTSCFAIYTRKRPTPAEPELLLRYSSLKKLLQTTAWCLHYFSQLQRRKKLTLAQRSLVKALTPVQLEDALKHWIKKVQHLHFATEAQALKDSQPISVKSSILNLNPFSDSDEILRVGGRLKHSLLLPDEKHPMILPRESYLIQLILRDAHEKTLHGGAQLMLNYLRQRFWIVRGRQLVKTFVFKCLRCWKLRASPSTQLMGDLPFARVRPFRAFLHAGVDYAGPIALRLSKGRGTKSYKGYISVFVCFSTRAVHLEAVSGYSTEDFLSAYRRFVGRRGLCASLTSDCDTNFVGADKELRALFGQAVKQSDQLARLLAQDGTEWRFNPPAAPHFGGIWEAAVKGVKHHLKRVIGETSLTFEEMTTLLAQIEACLNSRPLMALSDDPSDLSALTPGHFLIGTPLLAVPEPSLLELPESRLNRWQLIQRMRGHFWHRWSCEYLHSPQHRAKWRIKLPPIKVGDLCLVRMEPMPPCKWPLGRIMEVTPGSDGLPRVVKVRTDC